MDIIDYTETMTGSPIYYEIYIQQTNITVDRSILSSENKTVLTHYSIKKIVKNNLDTNSRDFTLLNLKVFPEILLINVKYKSLTDVLSVFGSYYSVFTLIATVLANLYSQFVYDADLLNSVFTFTTGGECFEKVYNSRKYSSKLEVKDFHKIIPRNCKFIF